MDMRKRDFLMAGAGMVGGVAAALLPLSPAPGSSRRSGGWARPNTAPRPISGR
jgi:hypothetical protein